MCASTARGMAMEGEMEQEGVIKFSFEHRQAALLPDRCSGAASMLTAWRSILVPLGLIGQVEGRYGGVGFGNVSARLGQGAGEPGARPFLITGTQTGRIQDMALEHFCEVSRYDIAQNRVVSRGLIHPSSESMTHGSIYDLDPEIRVVLHVHSPRIWHAAQALGLPITAPQVPYGTQAMALEVRRLHRQTDLAQRRVFSMAGHEDGVVSFGRTGQEAGQALMGVLAAAYEVSLKGQDRR